MLRLSLILAAAIHVGFFACGCGGEDFQSETDGAGASSSGGAEAGGGPGATGSGGVTMDTCAAGEVCLETPGAVWNGPVRLSAGEGSDAPDPCEGAWPDEAMSGFTGAPMGSVECASCQCNAPSASACAPPEVTLYSGGECTGSTVDVVPASNGTCTPTNSLYFHLIASPPVAEPGACTPHGGAPTLGDVTWTGTALLCAGAQHGEQCAEDNGGCFPADAGDRLCVYTQESGVSCPAPFSELVRMHLGLTDTRGCTECKCGPEEGATCPGGTLMGYTNNQCGSGTVVPTDGATCKTIVGTPWSNLKWTAPSKVPGECPASGGEPKGELTAASEVTICCTAPL